MVKETTANYPVIKGPFIIDVNGNQCDPIQRTKRGSLFFSRACSNAHPAHITVAIYYYHTIHCDIQSFG